MWLTVYCNKAGLSETLTANGACTAEQFEAFVIGFNQASPLFSFVDVGSGKERADEKIKGELRRMIMLHTSSCWFRLTCRRMSAHLYTLPPSHQSLLRRRTRQRLRLHPKLPAERRVLAQGHHPPRPQRVRIRAQKPQPSYHTNRRSLPQEEAAIHEQNLRETHLQQEDPYDNPGARF